MSVRLLLIRHGESVLGRERRYAGHSDTPLTKRGRDQAKRLRRTFTRLHIDHVYSSDLPRCRQTASLLAPGRTITLTPLLRELDFGTWEGNSAAECTRLSQKRFEEWMRDPIRVAPPQGESLLHLASRINSFAATLARRFPGKTLALVTHAGPIRVIRASRLSDFWNAKVKHGSFHLIEWDPV